MTMKLSKMADKYLQSQDKPTRDRINAALGGLLKEPMEGDIVPVEGKPPFLRLRIGNFRAVFFVDGEVVRVVKIAPRGQAYKSI